MLSRRNDWDIKEISFVSFLSNRLFKFSDFNQLQIEVS